MTQTIILRRGLKANLPALNTAELGYCTDTGQLFIGTTTGANLEVTVQDLLGSLSGLQTNAKTTFMDAINELVLGKASKIHTHTLSDITDLDASNKTNGYVLQYNATLQKWTSAPLPSTSTGGATSMSGLSDVDVTTVAPITGNVLTYSSGKWTPKPPTGGTGGSGGGTGGQYSIELARWGVSNVISTTTADVTLSTNNANGITNAMKWADSNGYSSMVLQPGIYLINEKVSVEIPSYFTLDLGGATLRIRDNAETGYGVVKYQQNQYHSRVTNGIIQGDRYNHDYYSYNSDGSVFKAWTVWTANKAYNIGDKVMPTNVSADNYQVYWQCTTAGSSGATEPVWNTGSTTTSGTAVFTPYNRHTHEWGMGVLFTNVPTVGVNVRHISVDNIEFFDLTGDGVAVMQTMGWIPVYKNGSTNVYPFSWEAGGISSTTGLNVTDTTRVRSTISIDLTQAAIKQVGYFGLAGGSFGGLGNDITPYNPFDIAFYNADGSFNSWGPTNEFFDEIEIPSGATTARVVLHQSNVPTSAGDSITVRATQIPKYVYVEKCHIYNCRRLGISVTGAKNVYIRECEIHDIRGTAPGAAIDVEDGYRYNQNIYIEGCEFHNNKIQLSFIAGNNFQIRGNKINGGIAISDWPQVTELILEGNFIKDCSVTFQGEAIISNNKFLRSNVILAATNLGALIDNCVFQNSSLQVSRLNPYEVSVNNCRFYIDSDYNVTPTFAGFAAGVQPQTMTNCIFEGYLGSTSKVFSGDTSATEGWTYTGLLFLNNKKTVTVQSSTKLARGTYIGCRFNNPGPMDYTNHVMMIGCSFNWDGYSLFSLGGSYDAMRFRDCSFYGGTGTGSAFYFSAYTGGLVEIVDCVFNYPSATSTSTGIIDGYWYNSTGGKVLLDGNRITSNLAMKFVNCFLTSDVIPFIMRNNHLEGSVTYVLDSTQTKTNNYINGVLDTPKWSTAIPTAGFYKLGTVIQNSNMATDGFTGWVCTTEGYMDSFISWRTSHTINQYDYIIANGNVYMNTVWNALSAPSSPVFPTSPQFTTVKDTNGIPTWSASSTHAVGDYILPSVVGGSFYKCTVAGTSGATEPAWGSLSTVVDGTATWTQQSIAVWKLMGAVGVFKPIGLISG